MEKKRNKFGEKKALKVLIKWVKNFFSSVTKVIYGATEMTTEGKVSKRIEGYPGYS